MFDFGNFSMVPTYQMEYNFGFVDKATVASYVRMGIITASDYQTIVGDPYVASQENVK